MHYGSRPSESLSVHPERLSAGVFGAAEGHVPSAAEPDTGTRTHESAAQRGDAAG